MKTVRKWARPKPPKEPIQCPFCNEQPPMPAGKLAQHVHNKHPLEWKGSIYASLPADFDYGNGPLEPGVRDMLIKYSEYANKAYAKGKRPYRRKMLPQERGRLGGLARAAKAAEVLASYGSKRSPKVDSVNGPIPRADRSVKFCPHCGWNIDATAKAQAFVDGRAE